MDTIRSDREKHTVGDGFLGWYFKCSSPSRTLALIPAVHTRGGWRTCSVQLITRQSNWSVPVPADGARVERDRPEAVLGGSVFSPRGIRLSLDGPECHARGELRFGPPAALRYDIMGPFRYVPFLECRHSVFSMAHRVDGRLTVNEEEYLFDNGTGYIEGDRGRSFPRRYLWTQCGFPGGSLMLSVADIPLGPVSFTGVIGVVMLDSREIRLATYLGARAEKIGGGAVTVRQGGLRLTAQLLERTGRPLIAPVNGAMSRTIRENVACHARYQLSEHGRIIWELDSRAASFEFEYP